MNNKNPHVISYSTNFQLVYIPETLCFYFWSGISFWAPSGKSPWTENSPTAYNKHQTTL